VAETLLTLRDIVVLYGERVALRLSSLDIEAGNLLAVIGPNGAGKSTLLRVMGLLQRPTEGRVLLCGKEALPANMFQFRRRIATVFQEPLLLNATVYQNAALGLKFRGLVDEIVGDAKFVADGAGVADGLRAAAFILGARDAVLRPELECDADDVEALIEQKRGGGGGIDSTAHANDHALTFFGNHGGTVYVKTAKAQVPSYREGKKEECRMKKWGTLDVVRLLAEES